MLVLIVVLIICSLFGLAVGINKYQNSDFKKKLDQKPIKIPEYSKRMIENYIKNHSILYEEWLTFKNKNDYFRDFYTNVLLKNINFEQNFLNTKNEMLLKQWFKTFKSQWSFQSLEIFYKQLESPYHLSVLSEIQKRQIQTENFTELGIYPLIISKPTEYQDIKKKFISVEHSSIFMENAKNYFKNNDFNSLKLFFDQSTDEKKFFVLPAFINFSVDDFIQNFKEFKLDKKSKFEFEMELQINHLLNKMAYQLININEYNIVICQKCYVSPKISKIKNLPYLVCPFCDNSLNLKSGYQEIIAVIGPLKNKNEIEVWHKLDKKIIAAEANSIILRQEENIDFDWALTSFLHEFELHFPQKTIHIILENVHLQENTLRFIQDNNHFILN